MESNWAAENLQTIRTLMERSAVYRRALAPIMLFAGALGVAAAVVGLLFHLDSMRAFGTLWLGTAIVVVAGALLIARRQAFKDQRAFLVATHPTGRPGAVAAFDRRDVSGGGVHVCGSGMMDSRCCWPCSGCFFTGAGCTPPAFLLPAGVKAFGLVFYCLRVRLVAWRCHHEFRS